MDVLKKGNVAIGGSLGEESTSLGSAPPLLPHPAAFLPFPAWSTGLDLGQALAKTFSLAVSAERDNHLLVGLLASHDGADHGLDRPRATPWGAGQSERDVARNPFVVCRAGSTQLGT